MSPGDAQLKALAAMLATARWQLERSRLQLVAAQREEMLQRERCEVLEKRLHDNCVNAAGAVNSIKAASSIEITEVDRAVGTSKAANAEEVVVEGAGVENADVEGAGVEDIKATAAVQAQLKSFDPQGQLRFVQALTHLRASLAQAKDHEAQLAAQRAARQADCLAQQRRVEGLEKVLSSRQKQKQLTAQTRIARDIEQTHLARCSLAAAQACDSSGGGA